MKKIQIIYSDKKRGKEYGRGIQNYRKNTGGVCPAQAAGTRGNVVLVDIKGKAAYIKLTGGCSGCPSAKYTLESLIQEEVTKRTDLVEEVRLQEEVSRELYELAKNSVR